MSEAEVTWIAETQEDGAMAERAWGIFSWSCPENILNHHASKGIYKNGYVDGLMDERDRVQKLRWAAMDSAELAKEAGFVDAGRAAVNAHETEKEIDDFVDLATGGRE